MRIALVGCGFVADYYIETLKSYPTLEIAGVHDRNSERLREFSATHSLRPYPSLEDVLGDDRVDIIVNLTNPRSHNEISRAALLAGKHVYSEKPLAMSFDEASALVRLAEDRGVHISAAPCSLLGETAQTIWRALRDGLIGNVRVVYAEMDEGMVYSMPYRRWVSASGAPWPSRDEFEVGTIIEHAGYVLSWLPAFLGPATTVTGFSDTLVPDKHVDPPLTTAGPDFAVAIVRFTSGAVARITCSLLAPHDHSVRIIGDTGVLSTDDTWYYTSKVRLQRFFNLKGRHLHQPLPKSVPLVAKGQRYAYRGTQQMDFGRGVADLASAIVEARAPRLSARYSLHINELVLAVNNAFTHGRTYDMTTDFVAPEPMTWATEPLPRRRRRLLAFDELVRRRGSG